MTLTKISIICAECFGELRTEQFPWKRITMKDMDDRKAMENGPFFAAYEKRMMIVYIPPLFLHETFVCQKPTVSKCNITGLWKMHDERLLWACEKLPQRVPYRVPCEYLYKTYTAVCAMHMSLTSHYMLQAMLIWGMNKFRCILAKLLEYPFHR